MLLHSSTSLVGVVATILTFTQVVSSSAPPIIETHSVGEFFTAIPNCALDCFADRLSTLDCPLTNLTALSNCACPKATWQDGVSTCVQIQCRYVDQVRVSNLGQGLCGAFPKQTRTPEIVLAGILGLALTVPFFGLRCASRLLQVRTLRFEDWVAAVGQLGLIKMSICAIVTAHLDFGLHYWQVNTTHDKVLWKLFYATQLVYILVQYTAKLAILLLYRRIFPTKWCMRAACALIAFITLHVVVYFFVIVFQCRPVSYAWNKYIEDGKCVNYQPILLSGAVFSIAEDFIILLMPLYNISRLRINSYKKVGVAILLGLGSFASIISILRLKYIKEFRTGYDQTWDLVDIVDWSIYESIAALVCGNLLTLKPLMGRLFSRMHLQVRFSIGLSFWTRSGQQRPFTKSWGSSRHSANRRSSRERRQYSKDLPSQSTGKSGYSADVCTAQQAKVMKVPTRPPRIHLSFKSPRRWLSSLDWSNREETTIWGPPATERIPPPQKRVTRIGFLESVNDSNEQVEEDSGRRSSDLHLATP